jgi:hypothetical protein
MRLGAGVLSEWILATPDGLQRSKSRVSKIGARQFPDAEKWRKKWHADLYPMFIDGFHGLSGAASAHGVCSVITDSVFELLHRFEHVLR